MTKYRLPELVESDDTLAALAAELPDDGHPLDLVDPKADNMRRAAFAMAAIERYAEVCKGDDIIEQVVSDLLSDLRHLCDAAGIDFDVASTSYHYEAEIRGVL